MYRISAPGYSKHDPVQRWALPDRVFFACGACHILAYAFIERYPASGASALWIKPVSRDASHIVCAKDDWVFDYHGYCDRHDYMAHTRDRARRRWPEWSAVLHALPTHVLISEAESKTYDGLWLREPGQFLHDALPRARDYLDRFEPPETWLASRRGLGRLSKASP